MDLSLLRMRLHFSRLQPSSHLVDYAQLLSDLFIVQAHVLCRVPFETSSNQIRAELEYVVESDTSTNLGEGLCIYLVDPSVEDWDQHFDGTGPVGFLGKKGVIVGVAIDLAGNLCGEPNHVTIKSANGDSLHQRALGGDPITPEDEWVPLKLKFDIESNTCDVVIGDEEVFKGVPLGSVTIPKTVCVGVCAGSNTTRHAHICVNNICFVDDAEDEGIIPSVPPIDTAALPVNLNLNLAQELAPDQATIKACKELFEEATMHVGGDANEFGLAALFSEHWTKFHQLSDAQFDEEWWVPLP